MDINENLKKQRELAASLLATPLATGLAGDDMTEIRVFNTPFSKLSDSEWDAMFTLWRQTPPDDCVERRGLRWFVTGAFLNASRGYIDPKGAIEELTQEMTDEARYRALKSGEEICACYNGHHCDIVHDPATCRCRQCLGV